MIEDTWPAVCVLCATRDRQTRLKHGHVCAACTDRLGSDIRAIADLAVMAAASLTPKSGTGAGHAVPSSKPPLNVDSLDPELTTIGPPPSPTVLDVVEAWERMIREERGYAAYGPASAARAALSRSSGTHATLIGCTSFLQAQVEWVVSEPEFPVDDFADEMRACVRVLRRWDTTREDGTAFYVDCPADVDGKTCGKSLRIEGEDAEAYFHCGRCNTEWSVDRLMLVWAETKDAAMWLDHEAIIRRYGVDRTTLDRWVRSGRITKWHGLYDIRPLALAQRRGA